MAQQVAVGRVAPNPNSPSPNNRARKLNFIQSMTTCEMHQKMDDVLAEGEDEHEEDESDGETGEDDHEE
ncbi:hypothetical protein M569_12764 [Genlisea aurea]|uniref:Uncharacterized protein n=1 Tax=Genlisea aurea TaxID=192259 RepID=S8C5L5_9LAMI|nr:hypothetical protein M569_12764 [Genlisea aurea]